MQQFPRYEINDDETEGSLDGRRFVKVGCLVVEHITQGYQIVPYTDRTTPIFRFVE